MEEVITHWTAVNALGSAVLLQGGFDVSDFSDLRDSVDGAITTTIAKDNIRTNAAGTRDTKRAADRERLKQFRASIEMLLGDSIYVKSVPLLPTLSASPGMHLKAFDDMANLWGIINANSPAVSGFSPPLKLAGAYVKATFDTDIAALRAAFAAVDAADQIAEQARASRDVYLAEARKRIKQYRAAVIATVAAPNALLDTIPAYSPNPGSTPEPANLSGAWNAGTSKGALSWTYGDTSKIDHYEVRYHPGPRYKAAEEQAVTAGHLAKTATSFDTAFGLVASGSVAWFKVYAVTSTGNEKGSNAVKIVRP